MEALRYDEETLSREQQMRVIGLLAEIRDKVDRENLRSRMDYRLCAGGIGREHIRKWSEDMLKKLTELNGIVR